MEDFTRCPSCGKSEMQKKVTDHYHFLESGLDNVFILKPAIAVCPLCGEEILMLSKPSELMECIGEAVISTPGALSAPEIKFLRKNLFLKSAEFANVLGVSRGTVSRWENGESSPELSTDRLIRMVYAAKLGQKATSKLLSLFQEEDSKLKKSAYDYFVSASESGAAYSCNFNKNAM